MDPVADARAVVAERYPAALAAFLGMGALSAARTPTSDLDITVLLAGPPAPFRESVRSRGWPVEFFVHDRSSLARYLASDVARRRPTLPRLCADGVVLTDLGGVADEIQQHAREILAAGPPPLSQAELDLRRYSLCDLLDDLAGGTDHQELAVIRWLIVMAVAELALLAAGRWLGSGKWLVRELRALDAGFAAQLLAARDDAPALSQLADQVLDAVGGRLWAGYRAVGT